MAIFNLSISFCGLNRSEFHQMDIHDNSWPNQTKFDTDKKWHKTFFSQCLEVFTPLLSISMAIGPTYNWQFQKGIFEILILAQDRCDGKLAEKGKV